MGGALSGIKVLDLTHHIAGPYCTKLLADFGAEVIKVERPGSGDPARSMGPFAGDDPHPDKGLPFLYLNTNKRSITLDLKSVTGRRILRRLSDEADLIVENFRPRTLASLGLSYESFRETNPSLVMVSISNFGTDGAVQGLRGDRHSRVRAQRHPVHLRRQRPRAAEARVQPGAVQGGHGRGIRGAHRALPSGHDRNGPVDRRIHPGVHSDRTEGYHVGFRVHGRGQVAATERDGRASQIAGRDQGRLHRADRVRRRGLGRHCGLLGVRGARSRTVRHRRGAYGERGRPGQNPAGRFRAVRKRGPILQGQPAAGADLWHSAGRR